MILKQNDEDFGETTRPKEGPEKICHKWLVNLPPPGPRTPPTNSRGPLWSGLINHVFPLIRPAIKPLFLGGGVNCGGGGGGLVD